MASTLGRGKDGLVVFRVKAGALEGMQLRGQEFRKVK